MQEATEVDLKNQTSVLGLLSDYTRGISPYGLETIGQAAIGIVNEFYPGARTDVPTLINYEFSTSDLPEWTFWEIQRSVQKLMHDKSTVDLSVKDIDVWVTVLSCAKPL